MIKTLENVKVIELSLAAAGPMCGKLLAEYGADVLLIEPTNGVANRQTIQFDYMNANKRSLPVNLKSCKGKQVLDNLLNNADIFISNYRAKALEHLGLDYASLHKRFPRLVYGTISGYGNSGPLKDAPGYDTTSFWSMGGYMHDMQELNGPPVVPPGGVGDTFAGMGLALGVISALRYRDVHNEGLEVSLSLYALGLYGNFSQMFYSQYGVNYPRTRLNPNRALVNTYPASDGYFVLTSIDFNRDFKNILRAAGRGDLVSDSRWQSYEDTQGNGAFELRNILDDAFSKMSIEEIEKQFDKYDLAFSRIQSETVAIHDPQAIENNYIFGYEKNDGKYIYAPASPIKIGDNNNGNFVPAPNLGHDTLNILREAGYDECEIDAMAKENIVYIENEV